MGGRDLLPKFAALARRLGTERVAKTSPPLRADVAPSNFARESAAIGRALEHIERKVAKLTALAKKDGIFDDPTVEISELSTVLKLDRDRAEKLIEVLAQSAESYGSGEQAVRHAKSIVKTLEMRLGDCTQAFTRALELRAQTMQLQQQKRQAFTGGPPPAAPATSVKSASAPHLALDMTGSGGGGDEENDSAAGNYMQQELLELDPQHAQVRAIQQIETTLHQLGQMFSQFSVLVQRQGEMIERIDSQVEQTQSNIERAQEELLKYYQSLSGNRTLIMKLFGVTAAFLVVFVMFF